MADRPRVRLPAIPACIDLLRSPAGAHHATRRPQARGQVPRAEVVLAVDDAVCRALRADPATAGCTIAMLTGTDQAADKVDAFSCGTDDDVLTPFVPRDLLGRTRSAMQRRREGRS